MAQVAGNPSVTPTATANPGQSQAAPSGKTKEKRGAPKKTRHPHLEAGGKFKEVPSDASKYASLKEEDFEDGAMDTFYDYQASQFEQKAKRLRANADRFRRTGSLPDKKVAKDLFAHLDSIQKMFDKLACDGVSLEQCNETRVRCGMSPWSQSEYNQIRVDAGLPPIGANIAA